jgi:hypothetical protein
VEQGHLWEYKPREKQLISKNEKTPRNLHVGRLYGGPKKGRDPDGPRLGGVMPARRNTMASKVSYPMAKGRRMKHQVFP